MRPHKKGDENLGILIKERAYTLTNRLVILMQLEARGLRGVKLISSGLERSAFRDYQDFFAALTQGDDRGYRFLLQQIWDELPWSFQPSLPMTKSYECIPIPARR